MLHQRGVSKIKKEDSFFSSFLNITLNATAAILQLLFLISNFRRVLNVVFFLFGDSPALEFYVPKFRNTVTSS